MALDPAGARGGSLGRGGEGQLNEQQADDPGQVATALAAVSAALGVAVPAQAEAVQCNVKCNPNVKLHHGAIDCAHLMHAGRDVVAPEGGHLVSPFVAPGSPRLGFPDVTSYRARIRMNPKT